MNPKIRPQVAKIPGQQSQRVNLLLSGLVFTIILSGYVVANKQVKKDISRQVTAELDSTIDIALDHLTDDIQRARTQASFIAMTPPVYGLVRAEENNGVDPLENTTWEQWRQRMNRIFSAMIQTVHTIDQLRIISVTQAGKEIIRVERDGLGVKQSEGAFLQDKGQENYYQQGVKLRPGEIYVSDISLNREYGKIALPPNPVFRVVVPVYNQYQHLIYLVVLNSSLTSRLTDLREQAENSNHRLYIVDELGEFILHTKRQREFGFSLGKNQYTWDAEFNTGLNALPEHQLVQVASADGQDGSVIVRRTFFRNTVEKQARIDLVAAMSERQFDSLVSEARNQYLLIIIGIGALVGGVFFFYQKSVNYRFRTMQSLHSYREIINNASDAIIAVNHDGFFIAWNRRAEMCFKIPENAVLGMNVRAFSQMFPEVDFGRECVLRVLAGEPVEGFETCITTGNAPRFMQVSLSSIRTDNNELLSVVLIYHDVTAQKSSEKALQQLNDSLEEQIAVRTQELVAAKEQAQQLSETKSQFLANMSHEIRTPMNAITGLLNILESTSLELMQKSYVYKIKQASNALLVLINDILDFSKIEAGKMALDHTPMRLSLVLRNVCDLFAETAHRKGVSLVVHVNSDVDDGYIGDPVRLTQVLINIVGNALKFTHAGYVELKVAAGDELPDKLQQCLAFRVTDSGIGIPKEKQELIFRSFSQADTSTVRQYGGTGLGLAISSNLIHMMGGTLELESEVGMGSSFRWSACLEKDPSVIGKTVPEAKETGKLLLLKGKNRSCVDYYLRSWGLNLAIANSADEARSILSRECVNAKQPFHLAMLDYQALIEDLSLLDEIKACGERYGAEIRIVVLTDMTIEDTLPQVLAGQRHVELLNSPVLPSSLFETLFLELPSSYDHLREHHTSVDLQAALQLYPLRKGLAVLLVEDNEINQEVAVTMLRAAGCIVETASDGKQAVNLAKKRRYDLILMDLQMPVMDGMQAAREIRDFGYINPILALSAAAFQSDREAAINAGMNGHICKPINPREFFRTIQKLTGLDARVIDSDNETTANPTKLKEMRFSSPQLDMQRALAALGNNTGLYHRLLARFCEENSDWKERFSAQSANHSLMIHSLKGAAGSLGAISLAAMARQLELGLRRNEKNSHQDIGKLYAELEAAIGAFRHYLDDVGYTTKQHEKSSISVTANVVDCDELAKLLTRHQVIPSSLLERFIQSLPENDACQQLAAQFKAYCASFDYDDALKELENIRSVMHVDQR